ncbi:unnamed protein product [Rotaria sordida]|uniref:RRP12 HEAT domain-containing protein n=1 Tax=Rotaria sordida TaxID=392033 RepID=A0A818HFJ2_9BILA|nr:unnamed protein product [Rotaria sordida]CAF3507414.1 unnamed protein product [Rotaria sordida]CAF3685195.1 unnamed protein product [Rotaria sordida]
MRVRLHKSNNNLIPKWKKHGASSSNPSRTKHRDAAKLQLLSSLSTSQTSSIDIQQPLKTTHDIDRISQYSKTTLGTTATNASMIQVNARVIQTLLERQPAKNDQQQMIIWLDGICRAYCAFHRSDSVTCLSYILKLFEICINECLLSVYKQVHTKATNVLKTIIKTILKPQIDTLRTNPLLKQLFQLVEHGLTYAYTLSWNYILHLLGDMFDLMGKDYFEFCQNCLSSLSGLRSTKDFSFLAELDLTVGKAIRVFGPKNILQIIPLNLTGTINDVKLEQSWLLPLLRDNITHTELNHFVAYFLPIAFQLQTTAENLRDKGDVINSTVLFTLQDQIWSLFPGYCSYATDISTSFKLIAKGIGTSLTKRPDLRLHLLAGLRNLISKTDNEIDRQEIGKYAKNYLPLLFNLFTTEKWNRSRDPVRQSVYETIKRYLTITDHTLCQTFFDRSLEKIQNTEIDQTTLTYLLDIVLALVIYLDEKRLELLEDKLKQLFTVNNGNVERSVMKKSNRILEELCSRSTITIQQFIDERRSNLLLEHLLNSLTKSQSALKGPQLRCISSLLDMPNNQTIIKIKQIVPQAIQCLHEINRRTRHEAYLIIIKCARFWTSLGEQSFIDSLTSFFHFLMAGLVSSHSPSMLSATLLAISRLCLEFRENLAGSIVDELLSTLILVLQSKERQVVQSALSFCRVLLIILHTTVLSKYIEQLARSLTIMRDENNFTFRSKFKLILQKLVKIFGFDALRDLFPASFHAQLSYINKMHIRKERRRKGTSTIGQSVITKVDDEDEYVDDNETTFTVRPKLTIDQLLDDSDDDNEQNLDRIDDVRTIATTRTTASTKRRRQQSALWIKESQGDDPIDLTEPTAARSIYATKPLTTRETEAMKQAIKAKRRNSHFRTAPDGRLVIDIDDEENQQQKLDDDDDDDDADDLNREDLKGLMETLSLSQRTKNKRKRTFDDDHDDGDDDDDYQINDKQSQSVHSKYRTGGGGIHRTLNQSSKQQQQRPGNIYKAKRGSGGDRKVANKHDPYAYIKLDFNSLNKRKRGKFKGQFEQIVGAAKRGANRGAKLGAKERYHKKSVKRLKNK